MNAFIPKGGMCANCENAQLDCSKLPFSNYPVIKKHSDVVVVRCAKFKRNDK